MLVFITSIYSDAGIPAHSLDLPEKLVIDRRERQLSVFDSAGVRKLSCKIGIGRGACAVKHRMLDNVTPTGQFHIDIILCRDSEFDQVDESLVQRYKNKPDLEALLKTKEGLAKLFGNMNSLDFDADGKPDNAYGFAYLGLDSQEAVTGPKLSSFKGKHYWFSIALHGTADEAKNIGAANSGGCIHVPKSVLRELIRGHLVKVGTRVIVE